MTTAPAADDTGPLRGLHVLELGTRTACRICGSLLAQMGAEVVAVESAGEPPPPAARRAALLAGKCSLRAGDDDTLVQRLLAGADVVILSSDETPPDRALEDAADRGRITVDLRALAAPAGGPLPDDLALQALSGMMDLTGLADGPPCVVDGEPLEMIAALHGLCGVLAALRVRGADGPGQRVDVALLDCAIASHGAFVSSLAVAPDQVISRIGNRHPLASPWNVFRARDGWLLVCMASEPQWQRACALMGDPELAFRPGYENGAARRGNLDAVEARVQAWVETLTVAEVGERLQSIGVPYGAVTPVAGYPREANLEHRAMVVTLDDPAGETVHLCGSPLKASRSPGRPPRQVPAPDAQRARLAADPWPARAAAADDPLPARTAATVRDGVVDPLTARGVADSLTARAVVDSLTARGVAATPLAGLRVIELGHYTTAPLATRYLANLGAEVIKIEPPGGEVMRGWQPQRHGQGGFFIVTNTGKRSLVLDLKSRDGIAALERLVRDADVLVENLKPGALARMGLDFDRMQALRPGFIYCAVSGFGADSVYPGRPAYDTVVQAMSGIMDRTRAGDAPVKTGLSSADVISANFASCAVLAAILHRDASGEGQFIDLSMQDVAAWSMQLTWNGAAPARERCRVSAVRDGHVLITHDGDGIDHDLLATLDREDCRRRWPGRVWPVHTLAEAMRSPLATPPIREVADDRGRDWPVLVNPIRLSLTPLVDAPIIADQDGDRAALLGG